MTHEEFHKKVLALTPAEKKLKAGEFSEVEFVRQAFINATQNAAGYYYLSNSKMSIAPENHQLRLPINYSTNGSSLRLLIHTRFSRIPFSYTEFIGVHYVYSGKMKLYFPDGEELLLTRGQLILINTNVVSAFEMDTEEDIVFGIQIQTDYIKKELLYGISNRGPIADFLIKSLLGEQTEFTYNIFDFSNMPRMNSLLIDLFCEYLDPDICGNELVDDYMHIFFILLIRTSKDRIMFPYDNNIIEMLKFIEDNSRNCSLQSLSNAFNFTPKYISALLKAKTDHSFSELLVQAKMKSICYLLKNTEKSIREITEICGYSNQTFFYQKFQELYHMTPKEYRAK